MSILSLSSDLCFNGAYVTMASRKLQKCAKSLSLCTYLMSCDAVIYDICRYVPLIYLVSKKAILIKQERLKGRNTLGCLDQYAAQNNKYARPPIPSQPPTQKVFFQWHSQYDPIMKHSYCETVYAIELFPMAVLWIGSLPPNSLNSPNLQTSWSH